MMPALQGAATPEPVVGGSRQLKAFKMKSVVSLACVVSGLIKATLAVLLPTILKELFKLSALV